MDRNLNHQQPVINEAPVGVYAYDLALVNDLRTRFNLNKDGTPKTNNNVYITSSENVFNIIGDIAEDAIQFPLISLTRIGWSLSDNKPEFMTKAGMLDNVKEGEKDNKLKQIRLQALPITINYQLDVWTRTRIDNDALTRDLIWYYTLNPQLLVDIPHGLNIKHVFNVFFENDIEDNSDIVEHQNRGQFFRQTLGLYVDDAYLWRSSVKNITTVNETKFEIYEGNLPEDINDKLYESYEIDLYKIRKKGENQDDTSLQ